jgi:hypothetical protein
LVLTLFCAEMTHELIGSYTVGHTPSGAPSLISTVCYDARSRTLTINQVSPILSDLIPTETLYLYSEAEIVSLITACGFRDARILRPEKMAARCFRGQLVLTARR